jgi:Zn finger protein HypA/HybF involved in hydrogenase expression
MSSELEKDPNDEVYEDSFYDNEEELAEEEPVVDDAAAVEEEETRTPVSFACDDCDYRWDDVIVKSKDDDDDEFSATCPMCGSMNVTEL